MKIIECVPNFSEGRNRQIIDSIAREISNTEGVMLLDVDPGYDANRTVITFAGSPEGVSEAAFKAISVASSLIDMRNHKGAHPRIGATDVCPFVPVSGVTMQECVEISLNVARRVGEQLGIPVYLYEESSSKDYRKRLADIRKGEYEGLREKLLDPLWKPDFGPSTFNEKSGATVIGARKFLIAYNINLNTTNVKIARQIATRIREKKDGSGLKGCRAIGWLMPQYGCAQVSMNITDFQTTPVHVVFEEVEKVAREMGVRVTGSELVGMIPLEAMINAGRYYLKLQGKSPGLPASEVLQCAIKSLGLNDVVKFEPERKIIEMKLKSDSLSEKTITSFLDSLSSDSPSPGGGSGAGFCGALGASLVAMIANISFKHLNEPEAKAQIENISVQAQKLKEAFSQLVIEDEKAYKMASKLLSSIKKSEGISEEKKQDAITAIKYCIDVPLEMMKRSMEGLELLKTILAHFNESMASDAMGALHCFNACSETSCSIVKINLRDTDLLDKKYINSVNEDVFQLRMKINQLFNQIKTEIEKIIY